MSLLTFKKIEKKMIEMTPQNLEGFVSIKYNKVEM